MAINIPVEVTGNASKGLEDLKARLISLIQRVKELSRQANASNREIDEGFRRSNISGRELTKTVAKITSGLLLAGGAGVRSLTAVAEKTKLTNVESQKFLIAIENFKKRYEEAAQVILPFINRFLDLTQVAATKQQLQNAAFENAIALLKKYNEQQTKISPQWQKIYEQVDQQLRDEKEKREKLLKLQREEAEQRDKDLKQRQDNLKLRVLDMLDAQAEKDKSLVDLQNQITSAIERSKAAAEKFDAAQRKGAIDQFNEEIDRQNKLLEGQQRALIMLGQAGVSSFTNMIFYSRSLSEGLQSVGVSIAQLLVRFALFQALGGQFGAGGILNQIFGFKKGGIIPQDIPRAQNGLIVRKPTMVMTGEGSKPEAIVPLAPDMARERERVMQQAGLGGGQTIVNVYANQVDEVFFRTKLAPLMNREVRQGTKVLASEIR